MNNQHYIDAPFVLATCIHWVSTTFATSKAKKNINTHDKSIFKLNFTFIMALEGKISIFDNSKHWFLFSTITFSFTAKHEEGKTFHQLKLKKRQDLVSFIHLLRLFARGQFSNPKSSSPAVSPSRPSRIGRWSSNCRSYCPRTRGGAPAVLLLHMLLQFLL